MGQICESGTRHATKNVNKNNNTPEHLRNIAANNDETIRFFMAGLGSAGKSTIIRQLQYLCSTVSNYKMCNEDWVPIPKREVDNITWQKTVQRNILDVFDIFIKQSRLDGETFASTAIDVFAKSIEHACEHKEDSIEFIEINDDFRKRLIELFHDDAIKSVMKKKNKINVDGRTIFDGSDYFLTEDKILEVFQSDYIPTDQDKVHSRNPTVDMHTYRFKFRGHKIEILDVRCLNSTRSKSSERLKNGSFTSSEYNRNFILLVVSMSDYNVPHPQYHGTRLDECVEYMKVLLNNSVAQKCGLLIFFNKLDRFKEKYLIERQIKDYVEKGEFNMKEMNRAIVSRFTEVVEEMNTRRRKNTYRSYLCVLDPNAAKQVFDAIEGVIKDEQIQEEIIDVCFD